MLLLIYKNSFIGGSWKKGAFHPATNLVKYYLIQLYFKDVNITVTYIYTE